MSSVSTSKVTRSWNAWEQSVLAADGQFKGSCQKKELQPLFSLFFSGILRLGPRLREHLKNDAPVYPLRLDEKLNKLEDRDTGHVSRTNIASVMYIVELWTDDCSCAGPTPHRCHGLRSLIELELNTLFPVFWESKDLQNVVVPLPASLPRPSSVLWLISKPAQLLTTFGFPHFCTTVFLIFNKFGISERLNSSLLNESGTHLAREAFESWQIGRVRACVLLVLSKKFLQHFDIAGICTKPTISPMQFLSRTSHN